jgi:hypothetical protein
MSEAAPQEATSILLGAIRTQTTLPNIIGITATSRLSALAQAGYDRVYSLPMDDGTERALVRHLSAPDVVEDEAWPAVVEARPPVAVRSTQPRLVSGDRFFWFSVAAIAILAAVLATFVFSNRSDVPLTDATEVTASDSPPSDPDTNRSGPEMMRQPEASLHDIERSLEEFRRLDPEALRQSRGFRITNDVAVVKAHDQDRMHVQQAYLKLFEVRERLFKRGGTYVAYYFDELNTGPDSTPYSERLEKITTILREKPLSDAACGTLRDAFGFEFENEDSEVRRWCEAGAHLESTLRSVRPAPK